MLFPDPQSIFPIVVGAIVSPLLIAAVIAILLSPRARINSVAFTAGAVLATGTVIFASAAATSAFGHPTHSNATFRETVSAGAVAALFSVLAIASWRGRPLRGTAPSTPAWMKRMETLNLWGAFGIGITLAIADVKNVPLDLRAGVLIGASDPPLPRIAAAAAVMSLAMCAGVVVPTVLTAVGIGGIDRALGALRRILIAHNASIMSALFAVLAVVEILHVVSALAR